MIDALNHAGYAELAEKVSRDLPDPVDIDQLAELGFRYGITRDALVSRMGGSP
ncbi:MAG TPA: hypothetical protein VGS62_01660 [Streptosporangiaceae bacterium]|nr:hypothetical protein [Streptosporangiaceae bacterium]